MFFFPSFIRSLFGLACDNVLSFECVLANGTIVTASPTSHPDLYFALRGGGNQHAIVTRLKLRTHPIGDKGLVWGGLRIYAADHLVALMNSISNFTASSADVKAAIIPTFTAVDLFGLGLPVGLVLFFYDGREPTPGLWSAFDALPSLLSDTRTRPYLEITRQLSGGNIYKNMRVQLRFNAFRNLPAPAMTSFLERHWKLVTSAAASRNPLDLHILSFALQPLSRAVARASLAANAMPNALGLDPDHGDRLWAQYDLAWANNLCDSSCPARLRDLVDEASRLHRNLSAGIRPTNYVAGDLEHIRKPIELVHNLVSINTPRVLNRDFRRTTQSPLHITLPIASRRVSNNLLCLLQDIPELSTASLFHADSPGRNLGEGPRALGSHEPELGQVGHFSQAWDEVCYRNGGEEG
ncbi:hypothetical protein CDD80_3341 [Ophiocordyceps camponoti-rufipedis]|uniref:Berberine/berberine-like domain-containing protein n=1 Tax=Ophiocordyceps camponoti-rufipedis TaxID=2004952 RepID=A0A2C5XZF9_9HYPO|nr:hypothetical protein CDD80_3341 [Ophiocordyceps camponoti-rufipedis]